MFVEVLGSANGAVKDGRWGVDIARVSDGYLPLGGRREFDRDHTSLWCPAEGGTNTVWADCSKAAGHHLPVSQ